METEPILTSRRQEGIGELAGCDSFYALEEFHGAKRYKHPFYFKMFSQGGREDYLEDLQYRYLTLLDYLFFEKESRPFYKELFLQELEDLIGELRALKVPHKHLKNFLKTKGREGDPLYEKILPMLQGTGEIVEYFSLYIFLFKVLAGTILVILAAYIYFGFTILT